MYFYRYFDTFSVVKAEIVGPGAATTNTYVTLKLQSVKSTTVPVKGRKPTWNQDFLLWVNKILFPSNSETLLLANCFSEVSDLDTGLLLEVWEKGMLWDKAIGYYWCPLNTIPFSKQVIKWIIMMFLSRYFMSWKLPSWWWNLIYDLVCQTKNLV